jgi:hypothetical protein
MAKNGVPDASASTTKKEDDEWLNSPLEEVPTTNHPEIQIKQDGSMLNITVIASNKQDIKSEQTIIKLKINLPPQVLARKGEGLYDIEITTDDSSSSYQSLQDIITAKPVEEPFNPSHSLMDEIYIRPVENQVTESYVLMDEVTVRPVESLVIVCSQLMDEISIRPVENQVTGSYTLMDEISIKPSPGPINIEYELLDDLITKSAIYRIKKAKPSSDAVITNSLISPVEKAEPVKTISVSEITEILKEKRDFKQATIRSEATRLRRTPSLASKGEVKGNLSSQAKSLHKKVELRGVAAKVLAALRIYNNNEFYIRDTNLSQVDTLMQEPQIKDFTFKVINTVTELDELIDGGYDLVMNIGKIKRGLKKGMVAFLIFVESELASIGWALMTEKSKANLRSYPYNEDLDRQACIVDDWTNPKFQGSGISSYIKQKRQQLLKEQGFIFERSIVEESIVKDLRPIIAQKRFELTYKRRTYTNVSLPGILGVEIWKEHPLNETDVKPSYQMITLLFLVFPSSRGCRFERKT